MDPPLNEANSNKVPCKEKPHSSNKKITKKGKEETNANKRET
jgi:hypothetical protein